MASSTDSAEMRTETRNDAREVMDAITARVRNRLLNSGNPDILTEFRDVLEGNQTVDLERLALVCRRLNTTLQIITRLHRVD